MTKQTEAQPLSEAETRGFALAAGLIRKADKLRPTTWRRIVRFKEAIEQAHGIKGTT